MAAKIPGAANVTSPTSDMIVGLGTSNPRSAQGTLAILSAFFAANFGATGRSGTVTANAATPVAVVNTNVGAASQILLTYKSGTQGATGAFVSAKTAASGFSIVSVTGDTAIYDYLIIN